MGTGTGPIETRKIGRTLSRVERVREERTCVEGASADCLVGRGQRTRSDPQSLKDQSCRRSLRGLTSRYHEGPPAPSVPTATDLSGDGRNFSVGKEVRLRRKVVLHVTGVTRKTVHRNTSLAGLVDLCLHHRQYSRFSDVGGSGDGGRDTPRFSVLRPQCSPSGWGD